MLQQTKWRWLWLAVSLGLALAFGRSALAQTGKSALLITEAFYSTPGSEETQEWIELANLTEAPIDLAEYKVGDAETSGDREGMFRFPTEGAIIAPGQVIVVARSAAGFTQLYGFAPDYEIADSSPATPDMRPYLLWGSGDMALSNSGDEVVLLNPESQIIDAMNYGDSVKFFKPSVALAGQRQSLARYPAMCDSDSAVDWIPQGPPTPGAISLTGECRGPLDPLEAEDLVLIGRIQGSRGVSALANLHVRFAGVVTGVQEDQNASGTVFYTLYVQDIPGREDGDDKTSDAIPVFLGRTRPMAQIGDQVVVSGQVVEFYGLTEIGDEDVEIQVVSSGNPLPEPIEINPPATDDVGLANYYESWEGMRVTVGDLPTRVVGPTFSGCGFAVVRGDSGVERIHRSRAEDPVGQVIQVLYRSDVDCGDFPQVKTGDTVQGIQGPLTYNFDQFKVVVQDAAELTVVSAPFPPLPVLPAPTAGQFSLVSFNVENLFDSIDDTGDDSEPKLTPEEINLKYTKISHGLSNIMHCPTLVGIQEVEKESLLLNLAAFMADQCGFTYEVTHRESADVRGIDVALLSDPRRVVVQGITRHQACTQLPTDIFDETVDCGAQDALFSRPPLEVDLTIDGLPHTIIVNHFKSKRGGEAETVGERAAQAEYVSGLAQDIIEQNPTARILAIGDYNDYEASPTLTMMTQDGILTNVLLRVPEIARYSYVYAGVSQMIDGLLVTPDLATNLVFVTLVHIDADYPDIYGQNLGPQFLPYRATDHDMPYAVFGLTPEAAATPPLVPTPAAANSGSGGINWSIIGAIGVGALGVGGMLLWQRRLNRPTGPS